VVGDCGAAWQAFPAEPGERLSRELSAPDRRQGPAQPSRPVPTGRGGRADGPGARVSRRPHPVSPAYLGRGGGAPSRNAAAEPAGPRLRAEGHRQRRGSGARQAGPHHGPGAAAGIRRHRGAYAHRGRHRPRGVVEPRALPGRHGRARGRGRALHAPDLRL
ncbi:MAG: Cell division protein MraZ, partial [uncultured Gemmatimonadetes bacterium]